MPITDLTKPIWKDYLLYDFNHMMFWKRQNYGDNNISDFQNMGEGGINS